MAGPTHLLAAAPPAVAGACVAGSYLLGTFPSARLAARHRGVDPTAAGSGNPGATNVYRTAGRRAGALTLAGDLFKGAAAAGVGWAVGGHGLGVACGVAAVVGHVAPIRWPVSDTGARLAGQGRRWRRPPPRQGAYPDSSSSLPATPLTRRYAHRIRYRPPRPLQGGKGVATGAGMALVLFPLPALVSGAAFAAVTGLSRTVSLGSMAAVAVLPAAAGVLGAPGREVAALAACAVLVIARHRANIGRLWRGEEPRFGTAA